VVLAVGAQIESVGRAGRESVWPRQTVWLLMDDSVLDVGEVQGVFGVDEFYPVPARESAAGRSGFGRGRKGAGVEGRRRRRIWLCIE
jgi:hypothetical protein